jgi:hypothetical protein
MSRYDSKTNDEVASRKSDAAQRRTRPADVGPPARQRSTGFLTRTKRGFPIRTGFTPPIGKTSSRKTPTIMAAVVDMKMTSRMAGSVALVVKPA